jgi:hypothetical protein
MIVMLVDFMLGFLDQAAHRLADLPTRPHAHLFHRLPDPFDRQRHGVTTPAIDWRGNEATA